jgi:transcriptional regulator with XRE-family HTH domain
VANSHPAGLIPIDAFSLHSRRMKTLNLIGRQVQKIRVSKHWSQKTLAEKLQLAGLDKSREAVGRIEARLVYVREYELLFIARVLGVDWRDLLPEIGPTTELLPVIEELMKPRNSTASKWRRRKTKIAKKPRSIPSGRS